MKKNVDTLKLRRKLAVFWRRVLRIQTMFSNQNCLVINNIAIRYKKRSIGYARNHSLDTCRHGHFSSEIVPTQDCP